MSNITITTAKGNSLRSFILNDTDGKPVGFAVPRTEGTYGKDGDTKYGLLIFDKSDSKITYSKCTDGYIRALRPCKSRKTGDEFNWEMFIEAEQFDLVKVKWTEDKSLAACMDAENELDSLYKAVKDKKGWVWDAFQGKTDKARKAELSGWLKDEQFAKEIREDYAVVKSAPRRPATNAPKRPAK